jgi:adenosylcobinamide kinase/adenosylcobinamide-phosphate guanylyltransferase
MRTLITGGVKTGKSSMALRLAEEWRAPVYFLATATAFDEEMRKKIARHQAERDERFRTIEEPTDIHSRLSEAGGAPVVLDCLTLWMSNLYVSGRPERWREILPAFLDAAPADVTVVTNEVGWGNIPENAMARAYNNDLGSANKMAAAWADRVVLMVAGLPLWVKGAGPGVQGDASAGREGLP